VWAVGTREERVSARAEKFKRDREGELDPDAQPEVNPHPAGRIASSTGEGLVPFKDMYSRVGCGSRYA